MFAIICLSIACIANSVTIISQGKEISKLRKRCKDLEFNHVLLDDSLSRLENIVDDFKGVPEAVPENE